MTPKKYERLEHRRARYAAQLGSELAAIIESDTGILTARMSDHERLVAARYREVVRQLAAY